MIISKQAACSISIVLTGVLLSGCTSMTNQKPSPMMQHGSMHEVIGQRQHHGRVALEAVAREDDVYAVGALAGLLGEITIVDSKVIVSTIDENGAIRPHLGTDHEAALLVGQSVPEWHTIKVSEDVPQAGFDDWIAAEVADAGLAMDAPFVFAIDGEFRDVHLHVINGACPVHARMKNMTVDPGNEPFELETPRLPGTLVGVFAPDAVGQLTHPATNTHSHLVFIDDESRERVTGHLERVGVSAGSVLRLPVWE